jgi:16S rRNA (cytosine967-C5)-methyltransferase
VATAERIGPCHRATRLSPPAEIVRRAPRSPNQPAGGLPARLVALDLLTAVVQRQRPLDEAIEAHPGLSRLDERDRGFARTLAATTLRRLGQIDQLIRPCLARSLPADACLVRDILRLGVAQLAFLATPPHAAVATAVDLARRRRHAGHAGLVNAVLRRLATEAAGRLAGQDAARLNTPDWLWNAWAAAYGEATARAIALRHLDEAPLDLTPKGEPDPDLVHRLQAAPLPTGSLRLGLAGGPVPALPGFAEGAWWVQDAAAALPAKLLGEVRGRRVFDLCAAPGGKTAQLAAAGADVVAVDQSPTRIARLAANLDRLGLAAHLVTADVRDWQPPAPADAVLLDVPCSATGTIRRHPDIAHLKRAADIPPLVAVQAALLAAARRLVRPGGCIVYCACSLQPEEGPDVVGAHLAAEPGLERLPVAAGEVGGQSELIDASGDLRTLPCHLAEAGGLDGFYAARLVRRA